MKNFYFSKVNPNLNYFFFNYRRRSKNQDALQQKSPLPISGLPVNCCGQTPSPNGGIGSLVTLSAFNTQKVNINNKKITKNFIHIQFLHVELFITTLSCY